MPNNLRYLSVIYHFQNCMHLIQRGLIYRMQLHRAGTLDVTVSEKGYDYRRNFLYYGMALTHSAIEKLLHITDVKIEKLELILDF